MEYLDNGKNNQLKNYGQWFQNKKLSEYKVPRTVLQSQCITPFFKHKEKQKFIDPSVKGFHFQKAKKPKLFLASMSPGPAFYNLTKQPSFSTIESNQKLGMLRNKSNRFQNGHKQLSKACIGNYNLDIVEQNKQYKQIMFGKAERASYFDQAMLNGILTPSPGDYQAKIRKSRSLVSLQKNTLTKEVQNSSKKAKRSISIGPWTYQIKQSPPVSCNAVMKNPYKEKDENMKNRISRWKNTKQNMRSPDPGKYLKIEEWGKFNGSKQISNGLKNLSRPVLKIYN